MSFTLEIHSSSTPLKNLRAGDLIYFTTPVDQIKEDASDQFDILGSPRGIFNGVHISREKNKISDAQIVDLAQKKLKRFKKQMHRDPTGSFTERYPILLKSSSPTEIQKDPSISSLDDRKEVNKTQRERSNLATADYAALVRAKIKPNIIVNEYIDGNPVVEVLVRTSVDGTIVSQYVTKSSGNKVWDDAALNAVIRSRTLPRDVDGRVPTPLIIEFRPKD
jgi:TolA protein